MRSLKINDYSINYVTKRTSQFFEENKQRNNVFQCWCREIQDYKTGISKTNNTVQLFDWSGKLYPDLYKANLNIELICLNTGNIKRFVFEEGDSVSFHNGNVTFFTTMNSKRVEMSFGYIPQKYLSNFNKRTLSN